jgi:hypothetical protein
MFDESADRVCAMVEMAAIERNTEMRSQNEKYFMGLRSRLEHSSILSTSLPE